MTGNINYASIIIKELSGSVSGKDLEGFRAS